ncbi:unnamed protein product, partial [Soboliphyme baturini]|uniref:Uncharacterized protein n=1 Tax=Soboliphyme baturini TaxID=241478 RepID=A0A183J1C9_9BILA
MQAKLLNLLPFPVGNFRQLYKLNVSIFVAKERTEGDAMSSACLSTIAKRSGATAAEEYNLQAVV